MEKLEDKNIRILLVSYMALVFEKYGYSGSVLTSLNGDRAILLDRVPDETTMNYVLSALVSLDYKVKDSWTKKGYLLTIIKL